MGGLLWFELKRRKPTTPLYDFCVDSSSHVVIVSRKQLAELKIDSLTRADLSAQDLQTNDAR